jgi:hypothetical protein
LKRLIAALAACGAPLSLACLAFGFASLDGQAFSRGLALVALGSALLSSSCVFLACLALLRGMESAKKSPPPRPAQEGQPWRFAVDRDRDPAVF